MTRLLTAAALAVAIASPAAAQVAGTYAGTSADGNSVSFTVTDDGSGNLSITTGLVFFSDLCKDGSLLTSGWQFGTNSPIVNHRVSDSTASAYFTFNTDLKFSNDGQSATGSITSYGSTLSPVGSAPTKALFCKASRQPLGLSLQPPSARVKPPAGGAMMYGKVSPARAVAGF